MHKWTDGQVAWLRKNAGGRSQAEITELFNKRFRCDVDKGRIHNAMGRYGVRSGVDGRFKPGQLAYNKGMRGYCPPGCEKGWFKKGGRPARMMPVGTVCKRAWDGCLWVKVGDPKEWVSLHRAIWECFNGPIPEGHKVLFGDGDRMNLSPSNLICVSSGQLAVMNKCKLVYSNADLTRVGALAASVKIASRRRKLKLKTKKRSVRK